MAKKTKGENPPLLSLPSLCARPIPYRSLFTGYSRSSRKRPPREFRKLVTARAGRLMGSRKRPRDETIEGGRLRELLA